MNRVLAILFFVFLISFKSDKEGVKEVMAFSVDEGKIAKKVIKKDSVTLNVYDFDGFEPFLHKKDDKVYVINFWATWCKPCVEELPFFERINREYKNKNVEVILVSLDMPKMIESSLMPFIKKNKLMSKVIVLDDPKMNSWIPKVDRNWGGSIPATVIYNKDKRGFYEKAFTYDELKNTLTQFTN